MLMLDVYATEKIIIVYSRFNKYRSGTQCVVTLFKAKVISRVKFNLMWNISLSDFRIQYVILLKGGIHTMY